METPVVFIVFNRPDTTEKVFAEIAKAKPQKLLVIADGPRNGHGEDVEKCRAVRRIIERVDWKCEVVKKYSDVNLGCGRCLSQGITWVFENVDKAIILEDDCLPHPMFFRFCEELLERYRDDERVMTICGRNDLFGQIEIPYSYSFRSTMSCWGWATWRRAWQHYDIEMKQWPPLSNTSWLQDILADHKAVEYWHTVFDTYYAKEDNVDTWDYQWAFACWAQSALAIAPATNLVRNIGFGADATHTSSANHPRAKIPVAQMVFPLRHPPSMVRDREADLLFLELITPKKASWRKKVMNRLMGLIQEFDRKYNNDRLRRLKKIVYPQDAKRSFVFRTKTGL